MNFWPQFRKHWKALFWTDLFYKLLAFVVLTPLLAITWNIAVRISGKQILADQDILFFFLEPAGWLGLIVAGGLTIAIVAIEFAALMAILASDQGPRASTLNAFRFVATQSTSVLHLAGRIVAVVLVFLLPVLAGLGATYFLLLGDFDINYYLKEKPTKFFVAAGIGGVLVAVLATVLLRLATNWFFALPMLLFEQEPPSKVLAASRDRVHSHRLKVLFWILAWLVMTTV